MVKQRENCEAIDKRPCFFKIISSDQDVDRLRIPPQFMKHISKDMTKAAILEGPFGGNKRVKLQQVEDGTYLQDGWQDFCRCHSLGDCEFLLFRYDGKMSFNVMIFDKTGSEITKQRGRQCEERRSAINTQCNEKKSCKGLGVESSDKHVKTKALAFKETEKGRRTNPKKKQWSTCMAPLSEELERRD